MTEAICQTNVMQEKSNIFNGTGKAAFKVPEGYFEELGARLDAIPALGRTISPMLRMKPYLALAACFLGMLLVGNAILSNTADKSSANDLYKEFAYARLIQAAEYLQADRTEQDTISDEDVVNYLIDSGASAELIEYAGLIAKK